MFCLLSHDPKTGRTTPQFFDDEAAASAHMKRLQDTFGDLDLYLTRVLRKAYGNRGAN